MNPARPGTQAFTPSVVKSVSGDRQNAEGSKEQRPVATIPTRAPGEAHVTSEKHSDKHQSRHRAAPWTFIAHAFALTSKSPGDGTRSFQYAHTAPLKKAAHARREQASVKGSQSD